MCGGSYPKFEVPKHLLKVNGEVLVERTIRLLRENGITDIAISTNNPAFDYLDVEIIKDENNQFLYFGENENKLSKNSWLRAYYLMNEPVCYLHGDVYFSDEAIKTIINTKVKDTMFFCVPDKQDISNKDRRNFKGREPLAYKVENNKMFNKAIRELLNMVEQGKFKDAKCSPLSWTVYRYLNGLDLGFNAENYGCLNNIFNSKGDYVVINDYTTDIDDIKDIRKLERFMNGGKKMVKVEVIEGFTLGDYDKLQNIVRKGQEKHGELFVGDVFECDDFMATYLTGGNKLNKVVVKVIEVLPKEKPIKVEQEDVKTIAEEVNKTTKKKKTSKKRGE